MVFLTKELKRRRAEVARLKEQVKAGRSESVTISKEQGMVLHGLLVDPMSKEAFSQKLPKMSAQRAIYEVCRDPMV